MTVKSQVQPNRTDDLIDQQIGLNAHTPNAGLTTTISTDPAIVSRSLTCSANEIAFIDKIIFSGITNDASTNLTITITCNGEDLPFHFAGEINVRRVNQMTWNPQGNMVVNPSQTLQLKASVTQTCSAQIFYRKYTLQSALEQGFINKSIPTVASTNSVTGSGLSAATAKAIVTGVAGYSIQVLGFALTGHNYNAAADSIALGFWDGTTGTFFTPPATQSAAASMIFVGHAQGASKDFRPEVLVGNTDGCIQGPVGDGLYVQATTNIAGATPTADFVVLYRLVKDIDVNDATGSPAQNVTKAKNWWVCDITAPTTFSAGTEPADPLFGTYKAEHTVKLKGYVGSFISGVPTAFTGISGVVAGGTVPGQLLNMNTLIGVVPLTDDGATNDCSKTVAFTDLIVGCSMSDLPAHACMESSAGDVPARCQLSWGSFARPRLARASSYQWVTP